MSDPTGTPEPEQPAGGYAELTVAVLAGGAPIALIGPDGDAHLPPTSGHRAQVIVALSRAIAVLAVQPDPASPQAVAMQLVASLEDIGGPAALEAAAGLQAAVEGQIAALAAATAVVVAAIPTAPGTH